MRIRDRKLREEDRMFKLIVRREISSEGPRGSPRIDRILSCGCRVRQPRAGLADMAKRALCRGECVKPAE